MKIIAYEMQYNKLTLPEDTKIECTPLEIKYFEEYKRIYNECFYEMRNDLDIEPYNYLSSYDQIAEKAQHIFLLLQDGEIVGSVACYGNEVDDLIVNRKFQNRGYGRRLLIWGMKHIRETNPEPVILHVAEWNKKAIELYKRVGFEVVLIKNVK